MENFPLNRLICASCRSVRSISEYPFNPDGLRFETCFYCRWRKQKAYKKRLQNQPIQQASQQTSQQSLEQSSPSQPTPPRYCSSCNQPRQPSQFGRFKTCEICRATNRKAARRKYKRDWANFLQDHFQDKPPTLQESAQAHLGGWVEERGEEEVHTYWENEPYWISGRWHTHDKYKRRPLTIDDYLQKIGPQELGQLQRRYKDRQEERQENRLRRQELDRQHDARRRQWRLERERALQREAEQQQQAMDKWYENHPELKRQLDRLKESIEQQEKEREGRIQEELGEVDDEVERIDYNDVDIPIYALRRGVV